MTRLVNRLLASARAGGGAGPARLPNGPATAHLQLDKHQAELRKLVTQLGQDTVASLVVLVDSGGQALAHWYRAGEVDVAAIAVLTAGSMAARRALSAQIGAGSQQSVVVQEYDGQIVAFSRVNDDLVLLLVLEDLSRLGWTRVALRRAGAQIARYAEAARA